MYGHNFIKECSILCRVEFRKFMGSEIRRYSRFLCIFFCEGRSEGGGSKKTLLHLHHRSHDLLFVICMHHVAVNLEVGIAQIF